MACLSPRGPCDRRTNVTGVQKAVHNTANSTLLFSGHLWTRHATSVRQGNWFSVGISPVSEATQ